MVDRSVGRATDETVPQIAGLAQALLDGEDVTEEIEIPDAPAHPASPPSERARREVRELIGRVEDSRLAIPDAPDPNRDPDDIARGEIDDLRAELEELNHRLGARRG